MHGGSVRFMETSRALADAQFGDHFHACAFVRGPADERAVIDPFLIAGMNRGQKAGYIVDPARRAEHEAQLTASASSGALLDVTTWNDAHLKGGTFDQDRMMAELDTMMGSRRFDWSGRWGGCFRRRRGSNSSSRTKPASTSC